MHMDNEPEQQHSLYELAFNMTKAIKTFPSRPIVTILLQRAF